mmetsp:Transcript_16762/g.16749  ORF Transcript_16762/g.16749 Transcript_16762/m.16749 type:complete len:157 (+) Transcript_16762:49-519(+)
MSQRRGAKDSGVGVVQQSEEILVPFSKSLDNSHPSSSSSSSSIGGGLDPLQVDSPPNSSGRSTTEASPTEVVGTVSLDERYHAETQQHKTKQWQESHFARTGRIFLMQILPIYLILIRCSNACCVSFEKIYRASPKLLGRLIMLNIKTIGKVHVGK